MPAPTPSLPHKHDRYCPECKVSFRNPADLRRHNKRYTAEKTIACPNCSMAFKMQQSLQVHIRTQHQKNYRYKRYVCQKGFEDKKLFAAHQSTHDMDTVGPLDVLQIQGREIERLHVDLVAARKAQRSCCANKPTCQVAAKDRSDTSLVFQCSGGCQRMLHWECVGYSPEMGALPAIICPFCLEAAGLRWHHGDGLEQPPPAGELCGEDEVHD